MTFKKKGDLTVETFTQSAADGIPELEVFRVHGIRGHRDIASRTAFEDYRSIQQSRWANGRYTLDEATIQIVQNTGADAQTMFDKLIRAVRNHSLPVYGPNKIDLYEPEKVQECFEEIYWDDLNTWLAENEKRIEWRFPKPTSPTSEQTKCEGASQIDKKAAIAKRQAELKRKGVKDYTAQTAKEFSVSNRYVSKCSKAEAEKPRSSAVQMAEQLSKLKKHIIGK